MKLYITEKPSVGVTLANYLGAEDRGNDGYIKGDGICITWAVGHLCELKMPQDYDEKYAKWDIAHLPIIPANFELKAKLSTASQLDVISNLLPHASEVINCADAGREGELIFRYLYQYCNSNLPIKRLWLKSMSSEAIKLALDDLKDGNDYDNLASAARCRSQADWVVGLNGSRAYSFVCRQNISIGRVQTPVLKMIVDRRLAIDSFKSEQFWTGTVMYRDCEFQSEKCRFSNLNEAEDWVNVLKDHTFEIVNLEVKSKFEKAPLLFDLTELQRVANKRLKWSADHTLKIAQELYEGKKAISYPRTDSRYLTKDLVNTVEDVLKVTALPIFSNEIAQRVEFSSSNSVFNDSKVNDHHAIIPIKNKITDFTEDQKSLYDIIIRRFIAAFSKKCEKTNSIVTGKVLEERFFAKGIIVVEIGWREVDDAIGGKDTFLPKFEIGESGDYEILLKEGKTQAPKEINDASLLTLMETAGKVVDDEELKEALKENGIGTPATRASVIEFLIRKKFIMRSNNNIVATKLGVAVINMLGDSKITQVHLTGEWENKLGKIERGEYQGEKFMSEIEEFTRELINEAVNGDAESRSQVQFEDSNNLGKCPLCGKGVYDRGRLFTCDKGCDFKIWKTIAKKNLTAGMVKDLLSKKKTGVIKGFTSAKGSLFDAHLTLDENNEVKFEFGLRKKKTARKRK